MPSYWDKGIVGRALDPLPRRNKAGGLGEARMGRHLLRLGLCNALQVAQTAVLLHQVRVRRTIFDVPGLCGLLDAQVDTWLSAAWHPRAPDWPGRRALPRLFSLVLGSWVKPCGARSGIRALV